MKIKKGFLALVVLLLAGCASVAPPSATVADGIIENHSLGFFGFRFKIPEGFELYKPLEKNPAEYNELQRMAIRIYDLNREYHPRDNELFYESFLLISDKTCFLLMTLKCDSMVKLNDAPFSDRMTASRPLMPFYNVIESRSFELGGNRMAAVYARGSAYEQKGWYYSRSKHDSVLFNYEACKVTGANRDNYVLIGFALPEDAAALTEPLRQMINGMEL